MEVTRGQYLFAFAHLCHTGPAEVDGMRIADFALLLTGIRQREEAIRKAEQGA